MTSYSTLRVNRTVCATVCEIQASENVHEHDLV